MKEANGVNRFIQKDDSPLTQSLVSSGVVGTGSGYGGKVKLSLDKGRQDIRHLTVKSRFC